MYQEEDEDRVEFMNRATEDKGDEPTVWFGVFVVTVLAFAAYGLVRAMNDLLGK